ncbi:MAG: PhoX family protein [Gammaproteobacteria bacterium]|nr:PhoX family protein [Gammaproteobacteria bacterium]
MNVVNETGPMAGRFMYRTHGVRGIAEGGAVSVIDLETGETRILAQDVSWTALDGIRWTPWGTLVFAKETEGGRFFEIVLNEDMMSAAEITDRPAVGRLAHEGIDLDADGNVYVVDEHRGRTSGCEISTPCVGGVYRFVPDVYGNLSTGSLYVLKVTGTDGTGIGEWVGPVDPMTARSAGTVAGGQSYQRPEDVELIDNTLYVAVTEGPRDPNDNKEFYEGRVISVDLDSMKVRNFIKADVNVPVEIGKPGEEGHQSGFDSVDNLAETPDGNLMVIEDNKPFYASNSCDSFACSSTSTSSGPSINFSRLIS